MHSWASHRKISYQIALLQADFSQTVIDSTFEAFVKADVFQRSLLFSGVFRATATVSTQTGILVILMTGCGLGRVNIRKATEKLTEVKGSSCNFKIILDLLKNGLCLGSAEADTVLYKKQLTYTKKSLCGGWAYASSSKIGHKKT